MMMTTTTTRTTTVLLFLLFVVLDLLSYTTTTTTTHCYYYTHAYLMTKQQPQQVHPSIRSSSTSATTQQQLSHSHYYRFEHDLDSTLATRHSFRSKPPPLEEESKQKRKRKLCGCNNYNDDDSGRSIDDQDDSMEDMVQGRQEALFAMLGSVWAVSTSSYYFHPQAAAHATAGVDAKLAFPDVMRGMSDRQTNKQCWVDENLGNNECLVYQEDDPETLLYCTTRVPPM